MIRIMHRWINSKGNDYYEKVFSVCNDFNYEEEAARYRTAPDDWHDHPYASFVPALPQGMTLNCRSQNDEILDLVDDDCTPEQAQEMFDNLQEMDYMRLRSYYRDDDSYYYAIDIDEIITLSIEWIDSYEYLAINVSERK